MQTPDLINTEFLADFFFKQEQTTYLHIEKLF